MITYKGYIIKADEDSPTLYGVATEGRGGKIPNVLLGRFTSIQWVKALIDDYQPVDGASSVRKTNPAE